MSDYLYRRNGPNLAAWQSMRQGGTAPDAPAPPLDALSPDRVAGPLRAAVLAYALAVSGPPPDAGLAGIAAEYPDIAAGPRRTSARAYLVAVPSPGDAGLSAVAGEYPDAAPGPRRATAATHALIVSPVLEAPGFVGPRGGKPGSRYLFRREPELGVYALVVTSPLDAGTPGAAPPIGPEYPDPTAAPRRAGASAYAGLVSATPAAVATAYIDTFTDTAGVVLTSHTPDAGGSWTYHGSFAGSAAVITDANRVRNNQASNTVAYHSAVPPSPDYDVSADLTMAGSPVNALVGPAGRIDTAAGTLYRFYYDVNFDIFRLGKYVAGTPTALSNSSAGYTVPVTLTLRMAGTSISGLVNGSVVCGPVVDSAVTAAGRAGLFLGGTATNASGGHLDNFRGAVQLTTDPVLAALSPPWPAVRRAGSSAYAGLLSPTPPDAGLIPPPGVSPEYPDVAPGPRRAASSAYTIAQASRVDPGAIATAIPAEYADAAAGPRRAAGQAYRLTVPAPPDGGLPGVSPEYPDAAAGQRRTSVRAYLVATGTPADLGIIPPSGIAAEYPDTAQGPRRGAVAAYFVSVGTPVDLGLASQLPPAVPVSPVLPPRRAAASAYLVAPPTPRDQGLQPPPVVAMPDRARGPRRAASSAYLVTVPATRPAATIQYHVYANDGLGGAIDYGTVIATTQALSWTSGSLAVPGVYRYGVRAFNTGTGLEEHNVDAVVTVRLDAAAVDITRIPDAPAALSATVKAAGSVRLDWSHQLNDATRTPTGFRVYYWTGGTPDYTTVRATVAYSRGTSRYAVTLAGLSDGVAYTLAVRAYNATGQEANTLTATATADATAPPAPGSLSGGAVSS